MPYKKLNPSIHFSLSNSRTTHGTILFLTKKTFNIHLKIYARRKSPLFYYRAGYIPDHYINEKMLASTRNKSNNHEQLNVQLFRSQLAGCKIVQEYLNPWEISSKKYIEDPILSANIRFNIRFNVHIW